MVVGGTRYSNLLFALEGIYQHAPDHQAPRNFTEFSWNLRFCWSAMWNGLNWAGLLMSLPSSLLRLHHLAIHLGQDRLRWPHPRVWQLVLAPGWTSVSIWSLILREGSPGFLVWCCRGSKREQKFKAFSDPGSELPQFYFCSILKVKVNHKTVQTLGAEGGGVGGEIDSTSWWEEPQSHAVKGYGYREGRDLWLPLAISHRIHWCMKFRSASGAQSKPQDVGDIRHNTLRKPMRIQARGMLSQM